jgi:hypothetical protein
LALTTIKQAFPAISPCVDSKQNSGKAFDSDMMLEWRIPVLWNRLLSFLPPFCLPIRHYQL